MMFENKGRQQSFIVKIIDVNNILIFISLTHHKAMSVIS